MTVPMGHLFKACVNVLWKERRPIHYAELARLAVESLGLEWSQVDQFRVKEDVREKLLEARGRGTFYTFGPHYCGAMREWFRDVQGLLFNTDPGYLIPFDASALEDAITEVENRAPHMLVKVAETAALWSGRFRGKFIEHHVSDHFKALWPEFWLPPDNANRKELWCDHDFKLRLPSRTFKIDVMGPLHDGSFGTPPGGGKRPTDLHVLASREAGGYRIHGSIRGTELSRSISPSKTRPITWLVVWLNCLKHGLPYEEIRRVAITKTAFA